VAAISIRRGGRGSLEYAEALAIGEHTLRVSVAVLIFPEGDYQVIRQGDWAGLAVLRAGTLLRDEQNLFIFEVDIGPLQPGDLAFTSDGPEEELKQQPFSLVCCLE